MSVISNRKQLQKSKSKEEDQKVEKSTKDTSNIPRSQVIKNNRFKEPELIKHIANFKLWSRFIMILSLLIYVWFTLSKGKEISLAKQKDLVQRRSQSFQCDSQYLEEIEKFLECSPNKCGRHVSDQLVTANEANTLLAVAKKGLALGGSDGGANILDLHSGALSYGEKFINVYSLEESEKIFNAVDIAIYKIVRTKIQQAIGELFHIDPDNLHLTHPTFFSKLTNLDPRTIHDEYWHPHVDKVTYESFHYTSLLYLSDYGINFEGGRLVFIEGPNNVTVEPRKGRVTMFTSGAENLHFVERVTNGNRYAITISFTCDVDKAINDPMARKPKLE